MAGRKRLLRGAIDEQQDPATGIIVRQTGLELNSN